MLVIGTEIEISGAHRLRLPYKSPCQNLHGHNWKIQLELTGPVDEQTGMIVDFSKIKRQVKDLLDHKEIQIAKNPTVENIIEYLVFNIENFNEGIKVVRLRIYETEKNWGEYNVSE